MKQVIPNLYVGNEADDVEFKDLHPDGAIVRAAKYPWHKEALGYTGRAAPKDHPEYLVALRGDELILNLVDAPKPEFIPKECFDEAVAFISNHLGDDYPVLVQCNQGKSRSVGIILFYLATHKRDGATLEELLEEFDAAEIEHDLGDGVRGALTEWMEDLL